MIAQRGAVLVETALVSTVILVILYGTVELGVVGVQQLTVDGAAYIDTHQGSIESTNGSKYEDPVTLAKAALPSTTSSQTAVAEPTTGAPPNTEAPSVAQYNLNNSNARHGGVSMILPVQSVGFAKSSNVANLLLGGLVAGVNDVSVSGVAIDPAFKLINGHGDVSGNGYNTSGAFSTASDPFVNGNNAPPYFVGYHYLKYCPWTSLAVPSTTCAGQYFIGVGLAEYLDIDNWGRPQNGVVPDNAAVFWEARLHQNKFAEIAQDLVAAGTNRTQIAAVLNPSPAAIGNPTACVYTFDNLQLGSYAVGTVKIGTYPLTPGGNPAVCGP